MVKRVKTMYALKKAKAGKARPKFTRAIWETKGGHWFIVVKGKRIYVGSRKFEGKVR